MVRLFSFIGFSLSLWLLGQRADNQQSNPEFNLPGYDASIVFREVKNDPMEGLLSIFGDEVPGFDHIALQYRDTIYEIHPGYGQGFYLSNSREKNGVHIELKTGVQWQHNLQSFIYNSRERGDSPTESVASIPIDTMIARKMRDLIKTRADARYQFIDHTLSALSHELQPVQQKGANGAFTCVGLIEWAAEKAGMNDGQGFVPDSQEYIVVYNPLAPGEPMTLGVLRPQLIYRYLSRSLPNKGSAFPVD